MHFFFSEPTKLDIYVYISVCKIMHAVVLKYCSKGLIVCFSSPLQLYYVSCIYSLYRYNNDAISMIFCQYLPFLNDVFLCFIIIFLLLFPALSCGVQKIT